MDWKIEVVTIPVSDIERARQFYAEKVGFEVDIDHRSARTSASCS
jgi:catechol 2,3-dioxygenase-like lactoylglutathione lyase family enzyme